MKKIALLSFVASSILMAGGYKIPENSTNAVALSAANIAHNHNSADAAYYNPAKMVFMSNENHMDLNMIYIGLDKVNYNGSAKINGSVVGTGPISSESESFLVPSLHYVSSNMDGVRFGLSIVSPGGLSKRWSNNYATYTAQEFTLKTVEINPTVALPFDEGKGGIAIGLRLVHSEGIAKSKSPFAMSDMTGNSVDGGYNIALAYQPTPALELGITYRSQIDLTLEGDATLSYTDVTGVFTPYTGKPAGTTYSSLSSGSVTLPLPATLSLAAAYTFETQTTVEFVYEKNYWSAYSNLDFSYGAGVNLVTNTVYGTPRQKNWKNTNAFRLGITQEISNLTLMGGVVVDETPVPDTTVGFELPGSDTVAVSLGGRYEIDKHMDIAFSGLYSMHENRTAVNSSLNGEFNGGDVLIVSIGLGYKF